MPSLWAVALFPLLACACGKSIIFASKVKSEVRAAEPMLSAAPPAGRHLVMPIHLFGLANRLRSLSCVSILAEDSKRSYLLDWKPSPECNVTFGDLFNTSAIEASGLLQLYDPALGGPFHFIRRGTEYKWDLTMSMPGVVVDGNNVDPRTVFPTLNSDAPLLAVKATGIFRPLHITCQEYLVRRSLFYRGLQPVDAVQRIVDAFYAKHMARHLVIGAHIRVDRAHDYPVVPDANAAHVWADSTPITSMQRVSGVCTCCGHCCEVPGGLIRRAICRL